MSVIYLIRHGQASFGEANYDQLSETGVRQAQVTARRLASRGVVFDALYTGDMARQIDTARAMAEAYADAGLPIPEPEVAPEFNEYDSYGVLTAYTPLMVRENPDLGPLASQIMTDRRSFQIIFEKAMKQWAAGERETPGLESWTDFTARVNRGLDAVMQAYGSGKTVAVFTSGGPISVSVQRALHLSAERTMEVSWQIMNATITRLKYSPKGVMLYSFNEFGHLETENDPSLMTYR